MQNFKLKRHYLIYLIIMMSLIAGCSGSWDVGFKEIPITGNFTDFTSIGGQPAFIVYDRGGSYGSGDNVVIYNGTGFNIEYYTGFFVREEVEKIKDIGGKLAIQVRNGTTGKRNVIYDGKRYNLENMYEIGNALAYVKDELKEYVIVYGDKEVNLKKYYQKHRDSSYGIQSLGTIIDVGGIPAAYVRDSKFRSHIIFNGSDYGEEYNIAGEPWDVCGDIAFYANNDPSYVPKPFYTSSIAISDGKVETTSDDALPFFIVYKGEEIGKEYDSVLYAIESNCKLAFVAEKNDRDFVVYDGQKASKEYRTITDLVDIDGKLAFNALNEDRKFLINYDGRELGLMYERVFTPINAGGKLAYIALKNCKPVFKEFGGEMVKFSECERILVMEG